MKERTGALLLALAIVGCSASTTIRRHKFDYQDVALLKNCFGEVVRKTYGSRSDGELSEPTATGMRFVFNYHQPVDGAHSEMVDLVLKKQSKPGQRPGAVGTPIETDDVFYVVVHRAKPGTDPVLREESARLADEILTMMASKRGTSPSGP